MGEATYYLKAEGCDLDKLTAVNAFIQEGQKAEDYWHKHRDFDESKITVFWEEFKRLFPTVYEMLQTINLTDGDYNNSLAGQIDFGTGETAYMDNGGTLLFDAYVWHFADWDTFCNFLEQKFGLHNARWLSDEYLNPYDQL